MILVIEDFDWKDYATFEEGLEEIHESFTIILEDLMSRRDEDTGEASEDVKSEMLYISRYDKGIGNRLSDSSGRSVDVMFWHITEAEDEALDEE